MATALPLPPSVASVDEAIKKAEVARIKTMAEDFIRDAVEHFKTIVADADKPDRANWILTNPSILRRFREADAARVHATVQGHMKEYIVEMNKSYMPEYVAITVTP